MDKYEILSHVDHTLLKPEATWEQVKTLCDEAGKYKTASACIPASFVKQAKAYVGETVKICTVIGFPNGYSTTATKVFEAADAVKNGADEVDMVANIGWIKAEKYADVLNEINAVRDACGNRILKVIVETCLLTDGEKTQMAKLVSQSAAEYIKTSTGFSTGGATPEDIRIFAAHVSNGTKIKAAGGISSFEGAQRLLKLGASRLGTSRLVKIIQEEERSE